jgi:hypothetical protein
MPTMRPAEARRRSARAADEEHQKVKARQKTGVHSLFRHVGNIFIPIIPGFIACGLILAIANVWKLIAPGVALNPWFLAFAALGLDRRGCAEPAGGLQHGEGVRRHPGARPHRRRRVVHARARRHPGVEGGRRHRDRHSPGALFGELAGTGRHHRRHRPPGCSR